jgi:hypothetical protein
MTAESKAAVAQTLEPAGGNIKDKNSLWDESNIRKKGLVCQEKKSQDVGYFFAVRVRACQEAFASGIAETKKQDLCPHVAEKRDPYPLL